MLKIVKYFLVAICISIGCCGILAIASVIDNPRKKTPSIISTKLQTLEKRVNQLYAELRRTENQPQIDKVNHDKTPAKSPNMFDQHLGAYVITGPSVDDPTYNVDSELIVNYSVINVDTKLLLRRYVERKVLQQQGLPMPAQPRLVLSGEMLAQARYLSPYVGAGSTGIALSYAELDAFFEITSLVNGFIALSYEDLDVDHIHRMETDIYSAFVTIGDFAKSPIYLSAGKMYLPFGRYESYMITKPLADLYPYTAALGRTNKLGIVLGYEPHEYMVEPYVRIFIANNETKYGNSNLVKQNGMDTGFKYRSKNWKINLGASYIANLADADSMVEVFGSSVFQGFHYSRLRHNVEGISIYSDIEVREFNIIAEYITALRKFNPNDLSFDNQGAKPRALDIEAAYNTRWFERKSFVAVGYTRTFESLALNIPKEQYAISTSMAITDNLIISLEYAYEINYGVGSTATGIGSSGTPVQAYNPALLGKHNSAVIAQIGIYF